MRHQENSFLKEIHILAKILDPLIHFSHEEGNRVLQIIDTLLQNLETTFEKYKILFQDFDFPINKNERNIGYLPNLNMENWRGQLYVFEKMYNFYNFKKEYNDFNVHINIQLIFNKYDWMFNFYLTSDKNIPTNPRTPLKKKYIEDLSQEEIESTITLINNEFLEYIKQKVVYSKFPAGDMS